MAYALDKKMISVNPAEGVDLPKQKKKTEFRTRHIDEQKTLNQKQVEVLIETAKKSDLFAGDVCRTYGITPKRDNRSKIF